MEGSPVWKKPSEVMKIHRRKSVSQKKVTVQQGQKADFIYKSPSKSAKRRNPFTSSENISNKRHKPAEKNDETESPALFSVLDSAELCNEKICDKLKTVPDFHNIDTVEETLSAKSTISQSSVSSPDPQVVSQQQVSSCLPVDWCLKTKLRVVSSRPLAWCTQLKSAEEAKGVTKFLTDDTSQVDNTAFQKEEFQKNLMYWIHPNLPWMRLFPRIIDDSRARKGSSFLLQDDVQASLQAAWEESFTSIFHQFRSRLCPYFYLCTHQFTVLFCESEVAQSGIVAMVTPTTRGFRELLQNEGITFTLPVGGKLNSPSSKSSDSCAKEENKPVPHSENGSEVPSLSDPGDCNPDPGDEEEEGEDMFETDEGASGWLESIGLDKKEFPSLDPRKVKLQREGFRVIDHRPESLVYVEGSDVQGLFNFLLNCRACTATSGAQAGVPPTILAPKGFKGATLKCHRVKHTVVKQPDKDGSITHAHIVEVTGPILPHHTQSLITLFHETQDKNFGVAFSNHDITAPFNVLGRLKSENEVSEVKTDNKALQNCNDRNLIEHGITNKHFSHEPISDKICAIKEIVCTPEGFSWNT